MFIQCKSLTFLYFINFIIFVFFTIKTYDTSQYYYYKTYIYHTSGVHNLLVLGRREKYQEECYHFYFFYHFGFDIELVQEKHTFVVHSNGNCSSVPSAPTPRSNGTAHYVLSLAPYETCMADVSVSVSIRYFCPILYRLVCYNIIIISCAQGQRVSDAVNDSAHPPASKRFHTGPGQVLVRPPFHRLSAAFCAGYIAQRTREKCNFFGAIGTKCEQL